MRLKLEKRAFGPLLSVLADFADFKPKSCAFQPEVSGHTAEKGINLEGVILKFFF